MLNVHIEINGVPTPIARELLAKDLTGAEYPANCYLDEPDKNGIYQPDPEALREYEANQVTEKRNEQMTVVGSSIEIRGHFFSVDERTRLYVLGYIAMYTTIGEVPEGTTWSDVDNNVCIVDLEFFRVLFEACMNEGKELFAHSEVKKAMIRGTQLNMVDLRNV